MPPPVVRQKTAVALAAISYCTDPQTALNLYLPGWKIVWNGLVTPDGNYAFIATDMYNYNYVLSIRGSLPPWNIFDNWATFANWIIEDMNAIEQTPWPYSNVPGALIADGSMDGYNNIANMTDSNGTYIYTFLRDNAVFNKKPITITGHSLGGNLANLYASYLPWNLQKDGPYTADISLYTFAAPAAGNAAFANDLDQKIPQAWHYEIDNDIVPKFPVSKDIQRLGIFFNPHPAAYDIYVDKSLYLTLTGALNALSYQFTNQAYQQPVNGYNYLQNALNKNYEKDTFKDWMYQAAFQHEVVNYCKCLGVPLITCATNMLLEQDQQTAVNIIDQV